jgi:hypothetical protein
MRYPGLPRVGCPIRRSLDRRLPAPPQSISPRGRVLRRPQAPRHPPCAHLRESVFVSSRLAPAAVRRARAPPRRHGRSAGPCLGQLPRRSPLPGSRDPVGMTRSALHLSMYVDAPCAGGAAGTRTPDLRRAKAALSQLSYGPASRSAHPLRVAAAVCCRASGGRAWTRTRDLGLIRAAL